MEDNRRRFRRKKTKLIGRMGMGIRIGRVINNKKTTIIIIQKYQHSL
jgi:hypothetical protein